MVRACLVALMICLTTRLAAAVPTNPAGRSPGDQCRSAIAAAERSHGVPPQLLAAIGRVESGRRDPISGAWNPWPWTINAEGQGSWFESAAAAIQAVSALRARGVNSIDVGCMQVNLMHHPTAFATLDMAFEPGANADYAASFLARLHEQTGEWLKAAALYHSANPWEGEPYAEKVAAVWPEEQRRAGLDPPMMPLTAHLGMMSRMTSPFAARQPPRMLPLGGPRPGMIPGGMRIPPLMQAGGLTTPMVAPRIMPAGMMQAGVAPAGGLMPAGMMQAGASPPGASPISGHGLAFYRAAPVGTALFRRLARGPYGLPG